MCGISGIVGRHGDATERVLAHRGPDGSRTMHLTLGGRPTLLHHSRLAIVDLTDDGTQPMATPDGRFAMVFNGEIYNHEELRTECESKGHRFSSRMDGEVILHLWEMEGPRCLSRLNGIFAVAIADTVTGDLFLARDPVGVKPLVYTEGTDGSITFASEPNALAELGADLGSPDVVGLASVLTFLWVPDPLTLYAKVRSLRPGHLLHWTPDGGHGISEYASLVPDPGEVRPRSFDVAQRELDERLRVATERQLLGDVPISVMASGGVDSSLVWDAAGAGVDQAYTIRWPAGSQEGTGDDAAAVERIERTIGTRVTYIDGAEAEHGYLPVSGDIYADPAFELTRLIARRTRADGRKVLLSGHGGDELFGGYRRHMVAPLLGRLGTGPVGRRLPPLLERGPAGLRAEFAARLLRASSHRDPFLRYMQLCTYSSAAERAAVLGCTEAEVDDDAVYAQHRRQWESLPAGLSFLRKTMTVDLTVYMPGLSLGYADRAGMEFGVEIRVPWLDLELIRWSFTLEDSLLVKRADGKLLPKSLARAAIPSEAVDRPKRGFAAPTDTLATGARAAGTRGHRQGRYFALASSIVDRWTDGVPATAIGAVE